jgi:hydroxymethylglutaryl-CoA reductase
MSWSGEVENQPLIVLEGGEHELKSELPGFRRMPMIERRAYLRRHARLDVETVRALAGEEGGLQPDQAEHMIENAIGVFGLPIGLCLNLRVDGRDRIVPMAIEEPSVIAAASYAAKLLRSDGGVTTQATPSVMAGQIQLLDLHDPLRAERAILDARDELVARANEGHPHLLGAGGGALDIEVRHLEPASDDDPLGSMMVVHVLVDVREAMGANALNAMCERLSPRLEALTGGRARLRILSNLCDRRTVTVSGRVPFTALEGKGCESGEALADGIVEASVFAERDPYRAATHNKGIMNGVDAVLVATGQDWRAVEAGAHAYASRSGRYTALSRWRKSRDGHLEGELTLPMAVGVVGGVIRVHPAVKAALRLSGVQTAADLAKTAASVGLAQNLGALRALAAEGIQHGHMRLHACNVCVEAGAIGAEIEVVSRAIAERGRINVAAAKETLAMLREGRELS